MKPFFLPSVFSCIISKSLVRMEEGDVVRFDTVNTAGLWNSSLR
jgi:hypothetical protein